MSNLRSLRSLQSLSSSRQCCCLPFRKCVGPLRNLSKRRAETLSLNVLTSRGMHPISTSFGSSGRGRDDGGMGWGWMGAETDRLMERSATLHQQSGENEMSRL